MFEEASKLALGLLRSIDTTLWSECEMRNCHLLPKRKTAALFITCDLEVDRPTLLFPEKISLEELVAERGAQFPVQNELIMC